MERARGQVDHLWLWKALGIFSSEIRVNKPARCPANYASQSQMQHVVIVLRIKKRYDQHPGRTLIGYRSLRIVLGKERYSQSQARFARTSAPLYENLGCPMNLDKFNILVAVFRKTNIQSFREDISIPQEAARVLLRVHLRRQLRRYPETRVSRQVKYVCPVP